MKNGDMREGRDRETGREGKRERERESITMIEFLEIIAQLINVIIC